MFNPPTTRKAEEESQEKRMRGKEEERRGGVGGKEGRQRGYTPSAYKMAPKSLPSTLMLKHC